MDIRSEEEIRESFIAEVAAACGVTDFAVGGRFVQLAGADARSLFRAQDAVLEIRNEMLLGSATQDASVEALAADVLPDGKEREAGKRSQGGAIVFSRPAGVGPAIDIPEGTPVFRSRDKFRYLTIEPAALALNTANSNAVSCVAESEGDLGNCATNDIDSLGTPIDGVTRVANTAPIQNGVNRESIPDLKDRLRRHTRAMGLGPVAAMIQTALEHQSETYGSVRFAAMGEAEATDRGGYIPLYIDDGAGSAGPVTLSQGVLLLAAAAGTERILYSPLRPLVPRGLGQLAYQVLVDSVPVSDVAVVEPWGQIRFDSPVAEGSVVELVNFGYYGGLVAELQRVIDVNLNDLVNAPGKRSAGCIVQVLPASVVTVTVSAVVIIKTGFDSSTWLPTLVDKVVAAVNVTGIGRPIYRARIYDVLMSEAAVENVLDLTINGAAKDLYVAQSAVARTTAAGVSL